MTLTVWILDGHTPVETTDIEAWGRMMAGTERIVEQTYVGDTTISTVFLGIDHRILNNGPPLLFETMVFGGALDQYQRRYSTWDDATIGHRSIVREVKAKIEFEKSMGVKFDDSC